MGSGLPKVLLADFYALPETPAEAAVVHAPVCSRAPCACFGITAEVQDLQDGFLGIRLLLLDEVVGTCRLAESDGGLRLYAAASYRASTTEDWAWHHQVVTELLLREAARVADERGMALATSLEGPRPLLAELGFAPGWGLLMRREPGAAPVCTEQGHDHATSSCRGARA